jgi:CheY-like chemotaxis protein
VSTAVHSVHGAVNGSSVDSVVSLRPQPSADAEPAKAKILLVDDEPKSLYALQELLSTLGETLLTAPSGEEALRLALKHDFAVILLDVRMPGIDGFETAAAIRSLERTRKVPIIFLSAQRDRRVDGRDGHSEFILKPVDPEVIRPRVAAHLARFRKH